MTKLVTILLATFLLSMEAFSALNSESDVYVVYYATYKGKTGHMGIAIDNYRIILRQKEGSDSIFELRDTVITGELTYYDLWPDEDNFNVMKVYKNISATYYKLPVSSTEEITLNSLFDVGIPHKEHYPADGLLSIRTCFEQDQWIKIILDSMIESKRSFNGMKYNCSDFVRIPIERLLSKEIRAKEFVLLGWSTTPNKLFRKLKSLKEVVVLKDAKKKSRKSFISQRVIFKIFKFLV